MLPRVRIVGFIDETPHLSMRVAEARESTQCFQVRERHGGALHDLGLFLIGFPARGFGAVEFYFCVRTIAERLFRTMPAAAQRVAVLRGVYAPRNPFDRFARCIPPDGLLAQRERAGDHVGPIFRYLHLAGGPSMCTHFPASRS